MWQRRIGALVIGIAILLVAIVVPPSIQQQREAARRNASRHNLRQLGLAVASYVDSYSGLPPGGIFDNQQRGKQGWLWSILPFVECSPLYNDVNSNLPWDSTPNAGLFLHQMPYYLNPGEPNRTQYWEFPVTHYAANSHLLAANSFVKLRRIDDQSAVFLAGELAAGFRPWGCPYNWRELQCINGSPPVFGRYNRDGCQLLMVDQSVRSVSNNTSKEVLATLAGADLTGKEARNVPIPTSFPCPDDALLLTWEYNYHGGRVEILRDRHGNEVSRTHEKK